MSNKSQIIFMSVFLMALVAIVVWFETKIRDLPPRPKAEATAPATPSKFNAKETTGITAVKDICDRSNGQLGVSFTVSKTITHGDTFTIQCLLPAGAEVKLHGLD